MRSRPGWRKDGEGHRAESAFPDDPRSGMVFRHPTAGGYTGLIGPRETTAEAFAAAASVWPPPKGPDANGITWTAINAESAAWVQAELERELGFGYARDLAARQAAHRRDVERAITSGEVELFALRQRIPPDQQEIALVEAGVRAMRDYATRWRKG